LACHLQIDADPVPVPDPAYHFDADPDAVLDPVFCLMRMWIRMRIQVTTMMIHADPDPQHWFFGELLFTESGGLYGFDCRAGRIMKL
jgi:hypothetical protein